MREGPYGHGIPAPSRHFVAYQKNPTVLELLIEWLQLYRQYRFAEIPGSDADKTPPMWFLLDNWSRWTDLREWRLPQASPLQACAVPGRTVPRRILCVLQEWQCAGSGSVNSSWHESPGPPHCSLSARMAGQHCRVAQCRTRLQSQRQSRRLACQWHPRAVTRARFVAQVELRISTSGMGSDALTGHFLPWLGPDGPLADFGPECRPGP
jgi:hypothetical protein